MKKIHLVLIFYFLLIAYLVINTGIFSDEFFVVSKLRNKSLIDAVLAFETLSYINIPSAYLTHFSWYCFFRNNIYLLDLIKIFYLILSFYMVAQFFKIFLNEYSSLWASFLFIFFPCHDSTVYSFMNQYLSLSFAFYLYAFYLAYHNKLYKAFLLALFASFLSYGSPPIALALFILCILNKEYKRGLVILIPNIIYWLYFIPLNFFMRLRSPRIIEEFSFSATIKQFILQILSSIDAIIGPSMWLKIYYGFWQLTLISFLVGIFAVMVIYKSSNDVKAKCNSQLIICLLAMLFFSFLIYAATGRYPQIAFSLGNRVTIFGSLLLAYIIVSAPFSRKANILFIALLILPVLGISDHWKNWNMHQQTVIANIKNNLSLKVYNDKRPIYVTKNQYSKYGPISHIDFFSEKWVPNSIFKISLALDITALSLNRRFKYADGYLIDGKYGQKERIIEYINVYDSGEDKLFKVPQEEINSYIDTLPQDYRHWVQILGIEFFRSLTKGLMPRLKYAL